MNRFKNLFLVAGLSLAALTLTTGCAGKTPARIAYNTTSTVITTADAAIETWADYVYFEQIRIEGLRQAAEKLPPGAERDEALGKMLAAKSNLLVKEGRVSAAYETYQNAAIAAVKAGAASADPSANVGGQIAAASAPLLALIPELMASP